ncbi:hypothetical protein LJC47_04445 [Desulfosarcina sp. OttesenSCG-928-B08]|nr:hypothetical protein [Desulfosarcina sp. OttesenSCG-928-B08]
MTKPKSPGQQAVLTDANGNVLIQIIGDSNSVKLDVGTPRLLLELPVPSPLPDKTDSAYTELKLLSPYAKDFPYRGFVQFLDDMKAFLRENKTVAARLVIGPGGRGKTRMALELCRHAREEGWEAGFAASENIRDLSGRMRLLRWSKDTLVIVDYASLVTKELREWFRYLMEYTQSEPSPKLRIVLLERHGSRDIGWWSELVSLGSWQTCDLDAILDSREPLSLPALTDPVEQIRVMQDTLKASGRSFTLSEQDDKLHQALDKMDWAAQPLYLKMAALCMQAENSVPVLGKAALAYELTGREGSVLGKVAEGKGAEGKFAQRMAAYATLTRGLTKEQYRKAIKKESSELGCSLPPLDFFPLLQGRLPGKEEDDIGELLPDVVGEAFILLYLDGQDACLRAYAMKPREVIDTLVRCVQYISYRSNRRNAGNPLDWLDAIYLSIKGSHEKLEALAMLLPERTTTLRQLAANVTRRVMIPNWRACSTILPFSILIWVVVRRR